MPIIHKTGDLFSTTAPVIAHGVNCRGAFGAGIACQMAKLYPSVKETYLSDPKKWQLGTIQYCPIGRLTIANCFTQNRYGREGKYANYAAIASCFFKLLKGHSYDIAMPRIGAGLGGGDWRIIEELLGDAVAMAGYEGNVYVHSL